MENQKIKDSVASTHGKRKDIPDGLWLKCCECGEILYNGELSRNLRICPRCNYYFPLEPAERMETLDDKGSLVWYDEDTTVVCRDKEACGKAAATGEVTLSGHRLVMAAVNLNFTDEVVGMYVCEKIVRAVDHAIAQRLPLLMVITNFNGAQNGNSTFCPAQAISTSAAISRLACEKLPYVSVLAHSDSQSHFPGFAYVADIVIAESNIPKQSQLASKTKGNGTSQAARTLLQNGMVDMIVSRRQLKGSLANVLSFFG